MIIPPSLIILIINAILELSTFNLYHLYSTTSYNNKQTRKDRQIKNYYEKISRSKQEKTFHEIVIQIGNKDDMNARDWK